MKGTTVRLHSKLPTLRAAKLKGFTVDSMSSKKKGN